MKDTGVKVIFGVGSGVVHRLLHLPNLGFDPSAPNGQPYYCRLQKIGTLLK